MDTVIQFINGVFRAETDVEGIKFSCKDKDGDTARQLAEVTAFNAIKRYRRSLLPGQVPTGEGFVAFIHKE